MLLGFKRVLETPRHYSKPSPWVLLVLQYGGGSYLYIP